MTRTIKTSQEGFLEESLDFVEKVFTESEDAESGKLVRYEAVIVEGNPQNYNSRGFETSYQHGIVASPKIGLPAVECLMVKELVVGALSHLKLHI